MTQEPGPSASFIIHDGEYFRRRAAEARRAASSREVGDLADIQGDLARAYAALARRSVKSD